jgi:tRNA dimethylallyltransferase
MTIPSKTPTEPDGPPGRSRRGTRDLSFPAHDQADRAAYLLVGPTAAGKSEIAQSLAHQAGMSILSADSMLVYRDMDIGTAKPPVEERRTVVHRGMDLADPDEAFSAGRWLEAARRSFVDAGLDGSIQILVGGTGLYVKALVQGMAGVSPPNDRVRRTVRDLFRAEGIAGVRKRLEETDSRHLSALGDPDNPRRLMRALELALMGIPAPVGWRVSDRPRVTGLRMSRECLERRIRDRVERMYAGGLLEEVRNLSQRYPSLSQTAASAIGYAEALSVLRGTHTLGEAKQRTEIRTRQLAKRQMTWFRNQFRMRWIDVAPAESAEETVEAVRRVWAEDGPTEVHGLQAGRIGVDEGDDGP